MTRKILLIFLLVKVSRSCLPDTNNALEQCMKSPCDGGNTKVCGTDGRTYQNECEWNQKRCSDTSVGMADKTMACECVSLFKECSICKDDMLRIKAENRPMCQLACFEDGFYYFRCQRDAMLCQKYGPNFNPNRANGMCPESTTVHYANPTASLFLPDCSEYGDRFKMCANRECVDENLICNGQEDCKDGSDESSLWCDENGCSEFQFLCKYFDPLTNATVNECMSMEKRCDGQLDCTDQYGLAPENYFDDGWTLDELGCGHQAGVGPASASRRRRGVNHLPARSKRGVKHLPARGRRDENHLPARSRRGVNQLSARSRRSVNHLPARSRRGVIHMPARSRRGVKHLSLRRRRRGVKKVN